MENPQLPNRLGFSRLLGLSGVRPLQNPKPAIIPFIKIRSEKSIGSFSRDETNVIVLNGFPPAKLLFWPDSTSMEILN